MAGSPLIVGNWKMNGTVSDTLKRITEFCHKLGTSAVQVVIAPPFTSLYSAAIALQETTVKLAGQNMHWESEGAYTGEVSGAFLKEIGCTHVILGHSERRRHFGETDEIVNRKLQAAFINELIPIFCVGETLQQREAGKTEDVLEGQLKKGLQGFPMNDLKGLVIAYEPVWAIGTGKTASAQEVSGAHRFIRDFMAKHYDAPVANGIPLLYGGSVTASNAAALLRSPQVDGLLVGGASLDVNAFLKIIRAGEA